MFLRIITSTVVFLCLSLTIQAQELTISTDFPGTLTWPFLWDIEQDVDGNLYTCSDQGNLHIKSEGVWRTIDLDPTANSDARGVSIGPDSTAWVGTDVGLYAVKNDVVTLFSPDNSSLPAGDIRDVKVSGDSVWISIRSTGLVLKVGDTFTLFNEDNSSLESNSLDDIELLNDGRLLIAGNREFTITGPTWTTTSLDAQFGFDTDVADIWTDGVSEVILATKRGLINYDLATGAFTSLSDIYPQRNYSAVIKTPEGDVFACHLFEGLYFWDAANVETFFPSNLQGSPSQVFDFLYYQDSVRVVGNIGATVSTLSVSGRTSVFNVPALPQVQLSPNPATGFIYLEALPIAVRSYRIMDNFGRTVAEGSLNGQSIEVAGLPTGTYHLLLAGDANNLLTHNRFVVQH